MEEYILGEKIIMSKLDHSFLVTLRGVSMDDYRVYFLLEVCLGNIILLVDFFIRIFDLFKYQKVSKDTHPLIFKSHFFLLVFTAKFSWP